MLTVCCVQVQNYCGRGAEYVNRLLDGVARHLPAPFRFVCITDERTDLDPEIEVRSAEPGLTGWWQKLALFKPGMLPDGPALFFDLDTIILGDLAPLADWCTSDTRRGEFAMLSDLYTPERPASGVMAFTAGGWAPNTIWARYLADHPAGGSPRHRYGDGGYIGDVLTAAGQMPVRLQDIVPGIASWKVMQRRYGCVRDDTRVLCFHGKPRPHETHIWDTQPALPERVSA